MSASGPHLKGGQLYNWQCALTVQYLPFESIGAPTDRKRMDGAQEECTFKLNKKKTGP